MTGRKDINNRDGTKVIKTETKRNDNRDETKRK